MKVSEFIAAWLVQNQLTDVFTVSGGGIAHLLDAIGRQPGLRYHCNYHEQASAVAAEGYARITGRPGVCLVTTGPGAMNALSGIAGAWQDSLPLLALSGQVRTDLIADYQQLRQKGPQEGNLMDLARPVTKYAVSVRDPRRIRYELERALHCATSGRPGPVWVELPLDVQGATLPDQELERYSPEPRSETTDHGELAAQARRVVEAMRAAERPLVVGGNGIQLAQCRPAFGQFIERFQLPVVLPYPAKDILPEAHPLHVGVFGTNGQRRANFAVQNADLLLCLGAGLSVSKVGFNYRGFAPKARKVIVDVDSRQIAYQALPADLAVTADLRTFLPELLRQTEAVRHRPTARWQQACAWWKRRYPVIVDDYFRDRAHVNMYVFMDRLADVLGPEDVLVTGNGFDVVSAYQAFKVRDGQRVLINGNWGAMGWDLPLAIGACVARQGRPVTLVTGDGGLQCNLQELLTVKHYRLPIKLFIYNNQGYGSIRATQKALFDGRLVGADPSSGVGCLDWRKVAELYDLDYQRIPNNDAIIAGARQVLAADGPALCEVNLSPNQLITPKASAFRRPDGTFESRPLEDMAPFLPREEVQWNMHLFDPGNTDPLPEPDEWPSPLAQCA